MKKFLFIINGVRCNPWLNFYTDAQVIDFLIGREFCA